jgi:hypothetical protein
VCGCLEPNEGKGKEMGLNTRSRFSRLPHGVSHRVSDLDANRAIGFRFSTRIIMKLSKHLRIIYFVRFSQFGVQSVKYA